MFIQSEKEAIEAGATHKAVVKNPGKNPLNAKVLYLKSGEKSSAFIVAQESNLKGSWSTFTPPKEVDIKTLGNCDFERVTTEKIEFWGVNVEGLAVWRSLDYKKNFYYLPNELFYNVEDVPKVTENQLLYLGSYGNAEPMGTSAKGIEIAKGDK